MRKLQLLLLKLWVKYHLKCNPEQLVKITAETGIPEGVPVNSILVFSNTAMGDTLLSTPAIYNLRQCFPKAKISLFIHKDMRPMFEGLDTVDQFIDFHGSYNRFRQTIQELRLVKPDIALLLHSNAPQDIPMAILAGARIILKPETQSQFRHYLSTEMPASGEHIIRERCRLAGLLGCNTNHIRLSLPDRYHRTRNNDQTRIGLQLGAADQYKMWPVERFSELTKGLLEKRDDARIIVTGSPAEQSLCNSLVKQVGSDQVINECGNWSLSSLPELIGSLDLLITNDTGTLHLAIALGVPTLSLFSPTPSAAFGPLQDLELHHVIEKPPFKTGVAKKKRGVEEISQISTEEVLQAALEILDGHPALSK